MKQSKEDPQQPQKLYKICLAVIAGAVRSKNQANVQFKRVLPFKIKMDVLKAVDGSNRRSQPARSPPSLWEEAFPFLAKSPDQKARERKEAEEERRKRHPKHIRKLANKMRNMGMKEW